MLLPNDLLDIVMDYHDQLKVMEMRESLEQHLKSLNVLEELMFAHRNYTTYELEFHNNPPDVIKNLGVIRGVHDPQEWDARFLQLTAVYKHPKITEIMYRAIENPIMQYKRQLWKPDAKSIYVIKTSQLT